MTEGHIPSVARNLLLIAPIAAIQLVLFRLLVPPGFLNGDVAWFVMVANEVIFNGQRLYVDFVEPNAPLASLIMAPAALFHRWAGLSIPEATTTWILALIGLSYALAFPLTRRLSLKPGQLLLAQGLLIWVMLILPGANFGQRESLFAILATPYAIAAALRATPMQIGTGWALPIGAAAAIGVGVKPPMVLCLLAVELASLIRTRRLFHPEAIVLAVSLFLYALATLLLFARYFELMQSWATSLYFAYASMPGYTYPTLLIVLAAAIIAALCASRGPVADTWTRGLPWIQAAAAIASFLGFMYFAYSSMPEFSHPIKFIVLAAAIVAGVCIAMGPVAGASARGLPLTLAAAATGSFLGFLLQWKGWGYQTLPAHYFATLALASSLAVMAESILLRLMQVAIVALPLSAAGLILPLRYAPFTLSPNEDILEAARQTEAGAFLVLSTNVHAAFPEAAVIGRRWALRYPCLILLPGLVQSEGRNGGVIEERYRRAKADFVEAITEDMRRHQPSLVMVLKGRDQALADGITGLDWLLRQRSFAEEWNHYREQSSSKRYRIFRRVFEP